MRKTDYISHRDYDWANCISKTEHIPHHGCNWANCMSKTEHIPHPRLKIVKGQVVYYPRVSFC